MDNNKVILEEESTFESDELFFSTTNKRGIILSGNSVFKRVSEWEWEELLGKPHNVIRHPDMPRGVFALLWETIGAGQPIGAYVKNRSKSGKFYWVFALVQALPDAYLSVRLKPSSPIFDIVKQEYQNLLEAERSQSLSPKASSEALVKRIKELGFESYSQFMIKALMEELSSRQKQLHLEDIPALTKLSEIISLNAKLTQKSADIVKKFNETNLLPLNLTLQAAKLSQEGNSLVIVANQYALMSEEIQNEFKRFATTLERTKTSLQDCQYAVCASLLQAELIDIFHKDTEKTPMNNLEQADQLKAVAESNILHSKEALLEIGKAFDAFLKISERIKTLSTGLEIVRLTGKIEISQIKSNKESVLNIIDDLQSFKKHLDSTISDVLAYGTRIQNIITHIQLEKL